MLQHERIKWVEEQNIHITLRFIGETEEKIIADLEGALSSIRYEPFNVKLSGVGIFGSRYDPRVVWAGIEPYDQLVGLMKAVHSSVVSVGFEPDRQNLVPHLTLGRIKEITDKKNFQSMIDTFRDLSSGEMPVREFVLYESILKKEGPAYVALKKFEMKLPAAE